MRIESNEGVGTEGYAQQSSTGGTGASLKHFLEGAAEGFKAGPSGHVQKSSDPNTQQGQELGQLISQIMQKLMKKLGIPLDDDPSQGLDDPMQQGLGGNPGGAGMPPQQQALALPQGAPGADGGAGGVGGVGGPGGVGGVGGVGGPQGVSALQRNEQIDPQGAPGAPGAPGGEAPANGQPAPAGAPDPAAVQKTEAPQPAAAPKTEGAAEQPTKSAPNGSVDGGGSNSILVRNTTDKPMDVAMFRNLQPGMHPNFDGPNAKFKLDAHSEMRISVPDDWQGRLQKFNGSTQDPSNWAEINFEQKTGKIWFNESDIPGRNSSLQIKAPDGATAGTTKSLMAEAMEKNPNVVATDSSGQKVIKSPQWFDGKTNQESVNFLNQALGQKNAYILPNDDQAVRVSQAKSLTIDIGNA